MDSQIDVILKTKEMIEKGAIDNVQFSLCWDKKYTDIESSVNSYLSDYLVSVQGNLLDNADKYYKIFAMATLTDFPDILNVGDEIVVLSILKGDQTNSLIDKIDISNDNFTESQNGSYYISVHSKDLTGRIIEPTTDVHELNDDIEISYFPNPVDKGVFNINIQSKRSEKVLIQFYDMSSRLIFEESVNSIANTSFNKVFDLRGIPKGTYFIRMISPSYNFINRVIVR